MGPRFSTMKWVTLFLPLLGISTDFGCMAQVFPIEEESILEFMQRKIKGKEVDAKMNQVREALFQKAKNPAPITRLKKATKSRSFLLDLSYKIEKDVQDSKGNLIARAGTQLNPLDKIQLSSGLLFLDGDQETHRSWARRQKGKFKWILVKGKPFDLESSEKRPIFYDQAGFYTSRFRIENIPAKIVQKGKFLHVEEIVMEDS